MALPDPLEHTLKAGRLVDLLGEYNPDMRLVFRDTEGQLHHVENLHGETVQIYTTPDSTIGVHVVVLSARQVL